MRKSGYKEQKAIIDSQTIPGYVPPATAYEVALTEVNDGVELDRYSSYDKAMLGMLDEP